MRSYKQKCGLAKALDVVGDRWTLLVVRELLIRGACRYTDLRNGLPGIATNLLADRLRELEDAGILDREEAPPPVATTLFRLTERGRALEPALLQLGLWGAPLLAESRKGEVLQPHWIVLPLKLILADGRPRDPGIAIDVRADEVPITITAAHGTIDVGLGQSEHADATVSGKPEIILQLFSGRISLAAAKSSGAEWRGATDALHRVVPVAAAGSAPARN